MPFNLGGPELIIVLVIVLIVFGAGKLPNVMRDVGKGVKEFKKAQVDEEGNPITTTTVQSPAGAPPTTVTASGAPVSPSNVATTTISPSSAGSTTTVSPTRPPETPSRV